MDKRREISEYRERLDKTLASPDLTDRQTLKTLIRDQLKGDCCSVDILEQRVADLSCILEKLRSVSSTTKDQDLSKSSTNEASYAAWKVKHDDEDCRVMYREGLEGSPFHTLLVEGYMDGPIQDCLCVSWESSLYDKWWPKSSFPAFRILETKCLQKFRIDEQICLVRMKVPWPMSNREAVVQFFLFEYFKEGLVIILLNSISSEEDSIEKNSMSEGENAVRIDIVGGVAIQKVSPERSYLRTISELDLKLDVVPPSLINLMSRQLLANGFRLFKKTIGSVGRSDEYSRVLAEPLYTRIHQALYSTEETDDVTSQENELHCQEGRDCEEGEQKLEAESQGNKENETQRHVASEIEEEQCDDEEEEEEYKRMSSHSCSEEEDESVIMNTQSNNGGTRFCISPEVKQALGTLEKVISIVRKSRTTEEEEEDEETSLSQPKMHLERSEILSSSKVCIQDPHTELVLDEASSLRRLQLRNGSSSFAREGNKIAPASPDVTTHDASDDEVTRITVSQATTLFSQTTEENNDEKPTGLNGSKSMRQLKKRKPGCLGFKSFMRRT